MSRVRAIVGKLHVSESWVIRRAVLQGLADVEREVLGAAPSPDGAATKEGEVVV